MLDVLTRAEQALPALLQSLEGWHSLDVLYEDPRVERLWRPFEDNYRLYLHRIHPCEKALYHPHPWPSAIKIVAGGYEMGIGFGAGDLGRQHRPVVSPPFSATLKLAPGSVYEMTHEDGWHYVLPKVVNLSVMITGAPWDRWAPGPTHALAPLTPRDAERLLRDFKAVYCVDDFLYPKVKAGDLHRSEAAARTIDTLHRVGLHDLAMKVQHDGMTCRLCGIGCYAEDKHKCWSYWEGTIAWIEKHVHP